MNVEGIVKTKLPCRLGKSVKMLIETAYKEAIKNIGEEEEKYIKKNFSAKHNITSKSSTYWVERMSFYYNILMNVHKDYLSEQNQITKLSNKKIVAAIFYFINSYDIIPDYKPGIGYVDDFYILQLCLRSIWKKDKLIVNMYINNES